MLFRLSSLSEHLKGYLAVAALAIADRSMTHPETEHYLRLNGKYLAEAEELLKKKDYVQASEKLWGAAAEIVKAVAAERGVTVRAHRSISEFVSNLDEERPGLELALLFHVANNLHTNFYEDWLDPKMVERGAEAVKSFVSKMQQFL